MSLFSVQARKHTAYYDHIMSTSASRTPAREGKTDKTLGKSEITSGDSACEDSRSWDKSRQVNRTYVISALSKSGGGQQTARGRLTLQRRSKRRTGTETAEETGTESSQNNATPVPEKRLTLQRRTKTPSMDKSSQRGVSGTGPQTTSKILSEPNGRTPGIYRSISLRETHSKVRETAVNVETQGRLAHGHTPSLSSTSRQLDSQAQTFKTPTKKTPFEKIAAKREVFEKLTGKEAPKQVKSAYLVRSKSRVQQEDNKPVPAPRISKASVHKTNVLQVRPTPTASASAARASTSAPAPIEQSLSRTSKVLNQQDSFKMENSAVTVAVRVRPFNARYLF